MKRKRLERAGEQLTLRPVRTSGTLVKEHGVWVFHTGQPLSASATDELLEHIREEHEVLAVTPKRGE